MDGRAWTATELSTVAEVSASTTSGHLARLLSNGLVVCLAQGRHRYYRPAGSHIAGLLENLMGVSMQAHKALLPSTPVNLRYARTCYDHLAGELAVNIYEFMLRENGWRQMAALTSAGKTSLNALAQCLTPAHGVSPAAPVSTGAKDVFIWEAAPARR